MGLKKCPICGEKFADTYKHCPFCEEDENPRKAKQPKRYGYGEGGRRLARRNYEEDRPRPLYNDDEAPVPSRRNRRDDTYDEADDGAYQGRRSRRDDTYDEADDGAYQGRRSRRDDAYDEADDGAYQGRRSRRDDAYDEADDGSYRGRRAADYDDDYDDYGEDRGSPWFKIVMVILLAIIIACVLYLGRGVIGSLLPTGNDDPGQNSSMMSNDDPQNGDEENKDAENTDPNEGTEPDVTDPDSGDTDDDTQSQGGTEDDDTSNTNTPVSGTLTLSHTDVSISGDESFTLSARSGSGDVTYTSADPSIATVSSSGVVTGVKKGTTKITIRRGSDSAECIVRVKSNGSGASSSGGSTASGTLTLSHTDVSIAVDERFTLSARSGSGDMTYTSADPSVATVSASGTVTGVKKGTTKITVSRGGSSATCIVRVK